MEQLFRLVLVEDANEFSQIVQIKEGFSNDLFNMQIRNYCQNER